MQFIEAPSNTVETSVKDATERPIQKNPMLVIGFGVFDYTMADPRNTKHGVFGNVVDMWENRHAISIKSIRHHV